MKEELGTPFAGFYLGDVEAEHSDTYNTPRDSLASPRRASMLLAARFRS